MKTAKRKIFLAVFIAFLLATCLAYAWKVKNTAKAPKKPVAVCGKTDKT
jgi:hypothetical protein